MKKTVWINGQTSENMSGDDHLKRIVNALDVQRNTEVVRIRNSQRVLLRRFERKLRRSASIDLENSRLKSSSRVNSLTRKDEGGTKVDHSNCDNCKELQGNITPIQTIAQGNAKGSKAQSNSIWSHPVDNDKNTTKPSEHLGVDTNKEIQEIISLNEAIDQTASWGLVLDFKIWFLNQKMVSQNMVSQSKNGFPKYGFSIKKWFPKRWSS